jgi:hypothetical protein
MLARYSFGWMLVPVMVFLILFVFCRAATCLAVLGVFPGRDAVDLSNNLCGWSHRQFRLVEAPDFSRKPARSLQPTPSIIPLRPLIQKLMSNSGHSANDVKLGGS